MDDNIDLLLAANPLANHVKAELAEPGVPGQDQLERSRAQEVGQDLMVKN
jgi:hypothetical protein